MVPLRKERERERERRDVIGLRVGGGSEFGACRAWSSGSSGF